MGTTEADQPMADGVKRHPPWRGFACGISAIRSVFPPMPRVVSGSTLDGMSVPVELAVALPAELRPPLMPDDVVIEADRCLDCRGGHAVAPCALACAAQVDVPAFIDALARDAKRKDVRT